MPRYKAPIKSKSGLPYKVTGNKKRGFRIAIPNDAYFNADFPDGYTCVAMQDGTLIYTPVHP